MAMMEALLERVSPPPARLIDAANTSIFARIVDSGALERGCVTIIGLDAIRERLGLQWPAKRATVWDAAERVLVRKLGQNALWTRISEVDFVISSGGESGGCGSMALSVLRELLEFFLGIQRFEDMKISTVTGFKDGEVACEALNPRDIAENGSKMMISAEHPRSAFDPLSFVTAGGEQLSLQFAFERIINLRNGAPIAMRVAAEAHDVLTGERVNDRWTERLSPADLATVNTTTVDGVRAQYEHSKLGVMTSCSIHALASTRNRIALVELLAAVGQDAGKPILFELLDIDKGTPQGRILEVVAALTPYCRKVVARTTLNKPPIDLLRGCRLSGLSVDCSTAQEHTRGFMMGLSAFAAQARTLSPLVFALGLAGPSACDLAMAAGATHAGCNLEPDGQGRSPS